MSDSNLSFDEIEQNSIGSLFCVYLDNAMVSDSAVMLVDTKSRACNLA